MSSCSRPPTPLRPREPPDSPDDVQVTSFLYDDRRSFRARSRHLIILLFGAAVAALVFFSQHSLLSESLLDPRPLISPQNTVATAPSTVVEPVVFALIMYSENSAKEGAILIKVAFSAWIDIETK